MDQLKCFKGCLSQILPRSFLNTLSLCVFRLDRQLLENNEFQNVQLAF